MREDSSPPSSTLQAELPPPVAVAEGGPAVARWGSGTGGGGCGWLTGRAHGGGSWWRCFGGWRKLSGRWLQMGCCLSRAIGHFLLSIPLDLLPCESFFIFIFPFLLYWVWVGNGGEFVGGEWRGRRTMHGTVDLAPWKKWVGWSLTMQKCKWVDVCCMLAVIPAIKVTVNGWSYVVHWWWRVDHIIYINKYSDQSHPRKVLMYGPSYFYKSHMGFFFVCFGQYSSHYEPPVNAKDLWKQGSHVLIIINPEMSHLRLVCAQREQSSQSGILKTPFSVAVESYGNRNPWCYFLCVWWRGENRARLWDPNLSG